MLCCISGTQGQPPIKASAHHRVILHFDLDCFYAQVEMIRNPELRHKPLGVQQKNIVVTCNYVARECGLTKLMSIADAKEKCPQLVLVSGENLTHYREISYKVTELLEGYSPLVERLGFDENFVDISQEVERRLRQTPVSADLSVNGHIYNNQSVERNVEDHIRLAVGSQIAAEIRGALHDKLGLTGCAGIASNKLLAKLVCGTFKPNQQTTLLPESISRLMSSLEHVMKVPGVGYRTAQRLLALGLHSVEDLRLFPLAELEKELGAATAQRIQSLSHGIDEAPVTPTGPPQSLSNEDSFRKLSTETELMKKAEELLTGLLERMHKDGRQPRTIRLTIRRFHVTNKWFARESRQCPIPNHIGQKIVTGSSDAVVPLVDILMKLFRKMIDTKTPFHLTLMNVCFSNLQAACLSSKRSIGLFLTPKSPGLNKTSTDILNIKKWQSLLYYIAQQHSLCLFSIQIQSCMGRNRSNVATDCLKEAVGTCGGECIVTGEEPQQTKQRQSRPAQDNGCQPPPGVDPEVFSQLPTEIQREIMSNVSLAPSPGACVEKKASVQTIHQREVSGLQQPKWKTFFGSPECKANRFPMSQYKKEETLKGCAQPGTQIADDCGESSALPCPLLEGVDQESPMECGPDYETAELPSNVDTKVFSELPAELQKELLTEWKQHKPVSKIHVNKHLAKGRAAKEAKLATAKSTRTNSLLKYFKHN
ncbi:POLI polymerase, partial [Amia calva]|nr:POLI polymerase [Amia calva]